MIWEISRGAAYIKATEMRVSMKCNLFNTITEFRQLHQTRVKRDHGLFWGEGFMRRGRISLKWRRSFGDRLSSHSSYLREGVFQVSTKKRVSPR